MSGFKNFIMRGNLVQLAVAVVIGTQFSDLVKQFGVTERDGSLQARTALHLGQVHDRIDQPGPAARGRVPGRGVQECPYGPIGMLRSRHLGRGDRLLIVLDFDMTRLARTGHGTLLESRSDPIRTSHARGPQGRNN
jgi:Large-conductance mechanosensitive channel, MscL